METNIQHAKISYQQCPVCSSDTIHPVLTAADHTVSREEFEIWECEQCLFRFTQHVPDENEIGAYYESEEYISHSNTRQGVINRLYHIVRSYTLRQKRNLVKEVSGLKTGSILDIGSGTGEFLNEMKSAGWETLGLEPNPDGRKQAKENYGLEIHEPDHLFRLEEDSVQVVSMWHVLEHVHKLHEYMNAIRSILKPGGTLIIAVPNYRSLDAEKYDSHWAAYDVPRHLYHFSPESMRKLLEKHKFLLRKIKGMPFDPFYVSMLSEKYLKGKNDLVSGFRTGLQSFMQGQRKPERSSSVIYIVKK